MPHPRYGPSYAAPDSPYVVDDPALSYHETIVKLPLNTPDTYLGVAVPGSAVEGRLEVYRNASSPEALKSAISPTMRTYNDLFTQLSVAYADHPALSYRKHDYVTGKNADSYTDITYRETAARRTAFGAGLLYVLQCNPYKNPALEAHRKIDDHVKNYKLYDKDNMSFVATLYLGNCVEWVLADLACLAYSITNTALYDTLGAETLAYILELTQLPVVVCSKKHVKALVDLKVRHPEKLAALVAIVSMDPCGREDTANVTLHDYARAHKIALFDFAQVEAVGRMFPLAHLAPKPETLYTISFTLGTTGANPKGVLLTQRSTAAAVVFTLSGMPFGLGTRGFLFLPLAHIYERETVANMLSYGGTVGFPQHNGLPLTLVEDLRICKPEFMSLVPRIYSRFEQAIKAATIDSKSALVAKVFDHVVATKTAAQAERDGADGAHLIYDKLLLTKVRKVLGYDRMRNLVSGSAPISPDTIRFLKATLGTGLAQGYGLTETFAGFCVGPLYEANPGSCGPPGLTTEVCVREIPEMGYFASDKGGPRGELLVRGYQNFEGYFKNPEETEKALDSDKWFHTGDIARIDAKTGRIYIVDRVKNFFKLAQGEYVTPEKVENTYMNVNSMILQIFVHGDSMRDHLVAVLGIDHQTLAGFLVKRCGLSRADASSVETVLKAANKPENRKIMLQVLNKGIKNLQGFEKVHNIYIENEPLTIERNVITPTAKIKRPIASKFFRKHIDAMYEEGSLTRGASL